MTGEEMERAIEFLLKNQADFDTRLNRLTEEVRETGQQLRMHADTQTEFVRVATSHMGAQARINADVRTPLVRISEDLRPLAATVQRFADGRG